MTEETKYRVRILARRDMTMYTEDQVPVPTKEVIYSSQFLTTGIVRIPLSEYSLKEEDKRIRLDIEHRLAKKPEIREV